MEHMTAQRESEGCQALRRSVAELERERDELRAAVIRWEATARDNGASLLATQRELKETQSQLATVQDSLGTSIRQLKDAAKVKNEECEMLRTQLGQVETENKKLVLLQEHYKRLTYKVVGMRGGATTTTSQQNTVERPSRQGHNSFALSPYTPTPQRHDAEDGGATMVGVSPPKLDLTPEDRDVTPAPRAAKPTLCDLVEMTDDSLRKPLRPKAQNWSTPSST